jgi:hypothetical protein
MNNFDKNWGNAKTSIFRLEGRPEYKVPGEPELIAKWKQGELDLSGNKEWQKWLGSLKKAKAKKVPVKRVRVVPKPMPDYIKYEIAAWQEYSAKNGEEFFFINTSDYNEIISGCGFNLKDFWLFDDEKLLILNYSPAGLFTNDILIADGGMVNRYRELKAKLLQKAVPMETFVKKM